MKKIIIVGRGLAATCLMHQCRTQNIDFICIGKDNLSLSSRVAGGVWNPVVFKRMTSSWMADQLVPSLLAFYRLCEERLGEKFVQIRQLIKPFTETQEKNLWQKKAGGELQQFLDMKMHDAGQMHEGLSISNQYGEVKQAGNLNTNLFLDASAKYFRAQIIDEIFDYAALQMNQSGLHYKHLSADAIVFCEGYLVKNNPYFNWVPLVPAKGETLTISGLGLKLSDFIFNKDGFLIDLGNDTYKVGATYEWKDLSDATSEAGKLSLIQKLSKITTRPYKIEAHEAGVRPSSIDRRPIIGTHPEHPQLYIFNGLGAKGVMLAPYFTENFVHCYLQKQTLPAEVDVKRFYHMYESSTTK